MIDLIRFWVQTCSLIWFCPTFSSTQERMNSIKVLEIKTWRMQRLAEVSGGLCSGLRELKLFIWFFIIWSWQYWCYSRGVSSPPNSQCLMVIKNSLGNKISFSHWIILTTTKHLHHLHQYHKTATNSIILCQGFVRNWQKI